MRALQSCDFCGDDAVGTFEVVPDEFLRSDADQRRIALCDHCKTTLEGVLEPFLRNDARAVGNEQGDSDPVTESPTAEAVEEGETVQSPTSAAVDATARAEGISIGRTGDSSATENGGSDESAPLAADEGVVSEESDDGEDNASDVGDEPDQFRKVMRLLSNREFPVDRAEFAELTAGAYELDDEHVSRIIDHAVDRGVIVDEKGTLKKN